MSSPEPGNQPVVKDDPFGIIKSERRDNVPTARQVSELHTKADLDASTSSMHHTLGISHNQASPGDHSHDGQTSRLIGQGRNITITGAKGGNVALGSLISALKQVMDITDNTTA